MVSSCTSGGGDNVTLSTDSQVPDPVVLEVAIAYVRRPLPEETPDLRDPLAFFPGAQLLVRERSAVSADEIDITPRIAELVAAEEGVASDTLAIDIKGLESSFDGGTLIFSARIVPEPVAENLELSTWNLWLLDLESLQPQYLIPSRIKRNEGVETGGSHDIAPHFLGDDRIVFSSTRQVASQARQLNEGRIQIFAALDEDGRNPAAVLHIYDPLQRDREFQQISFNLSHDLDPVVLSSGEIVFSRWNNTATNHISLYRIAPSGLQLSPLYGFHSQGSGSGGSAVEFTQARELDDGTLLSVIRPFAATSFGGDIVAIDTGNYAEFEQPTWANQGLGGSGQTPLTDTEVRSDGEISSGGQFGSVYPLRDGTGRSLVTWSQCRVIAEDGGIVPCTQEPENPNPAPPLYGAWVYDGLEDTQRPVVLAQEGFMISEVIAAEPRAFPALLPQPDSFNAGLALANQGQLLIDSVYDFDGVDESPLGIANHATPGTSAFRERPARFLRIVLPVPIPDDEVFDIPDFASGVAPRRSFREIAGYVPIEPDGSVTAILPANQAFRFSVLADNGRRIGPRHNYWLQLGAGEVLHCRGCHRADSIGPHGRWDSLPDSSNPGARPLADGGSGFPGTDTVTLFAKEAGQTMAQTRDYQQSLGNAMQTGREMLLTISYSDEWSDPQLVPDPAINDRDYDPNWTDIPIGRPIIVDNLDPTLPSRIVINYIDHIQPIWERQRAPVDDSSGLPVDTCLGCHDSESGMVVAAGQLDLSAVSSDIDPDHMRSYRELLSVDVEQWIDTAGNVSDRQRLCTELDEDGNVLTTTVALELQAPMRAGSATASSGFFACFEGGACGTESQPPLPNNCTEDGGTVVPATTNTIDHRGLLSPSELRLISEWLDIGAQYYNNPFDTRLQ
ncbi:MAG: hypothetical protein O7F73_10100 [Gammaproteobacteria bacterium]|nr:hypothetical protein [Gammaproteobacteria bacterium]